MTDTPITPIQHSHLKTVEAGEGGKAELYTAQAWRLAERGYLRHVESAGRARAVYEITEAGRKVLAAA